VLTSIVLFGPPPWPTASIAIVATPRAALRSAARNTSYFERPKPWPKMATGQPPAGGAPDGTISAKPIRSVPTGRSVRRVGVACITRWLPSQAGARNEPNAYRPALVVARFGTSAAVVAPAVVVCTTARSPVTAAAWKALSTCSPRSAGGMPAWE
jgi:hypothetical protein